MTALTEYERLEAPGLWRADPAAQRLDVIVSIGDATLTLSDHAERPLSHWSLAAVHRLNPGKIPALYAPSEDPEENEQLEIDDENMISAIERVRKAIARRRPRRGRLRVALTAATGLVLAAGAILWLPGALTRQTVALLPDVTRAELGQELLTRLRRVTGAPCEAPAGQAAMARLSRRVLGPTPPRIVVLNEGVADAAHLPGRTILVNRTLIEGYDEPDVLAGYLMAETLRMAQTDPVRALLDEAGLRATVKLLTTGALSTATLDRYAEALLTAPPEPLPDAVLLAGFAEARLRATPYAFAVDPSGESTLALIEADPVPVSAAEPLIPDSAWVSLQGICAD